MKTKPTIRRFLHYRHDPELQVIRERLESLFRQNNLRQRILDFYEAFEGIDGYWGRETDLWAPLLAIAQAVDHEKPGWRLHEKVLGIARKDIRRRRQESFFRWENKLLLVIHRYLKDRYYTSDQYVVAEDLKEYLNKLLKPRYPFKTESLGRALNASSLLLDRKVKWVGEHGNLVQRTCYWIDVEKLSRIIRKFEKFIEPEEEPSSPTGEDLSEILCDDINFEEQK